MSQSLTALYLQNPQLAQAISRRARGQQMLQQGGDSSPIDSPWQGVARLAQALVGGYEQGQADKSIKAEGDKQQALMAQLMAPIGQPQQAAPEMHAAPPMAPRQPVAQQSMAPPDLDPLIQKASQETGIPAPLLTGLFAQESGFRPDARNPRSTATGIAQVLDSTAANPGYGMAPLSPEARLDPQQAIPWAAQYLARRGQSLGVTDWNNPQQAERGLRAYGENTPEYAQAVMRRAGMGGAPQGDMAMPVQMPGGAPPAPRTPDATQHYTQQAQEYQRRAQMAIAGGRTDLAGILQQQAQMAQQMAMARAPQPSETERLLSASGLQPGTPAYQDMARRLLEAKERPMVNITNTGEGQFEKDRAQTYAKRVGEWEDASTKGAQTLSRLTRMEEMLNNFTTGAGSRTAITAGQLAQRLGVPAATMEGLGIDPAKIAQGEAIGSLASQMLVGMIGAGGFPSQGFSNADRDMLERALPGLANSPGGNRVIMQIMRAGAQRDLEIGRAWRDWSRTKGDSLASVRDFQAEKLPGIIERDVVTPILEGWTETNPASGAASAIPTIADPAEAQRLPPGTQFRTPDGRTLRVPAR